MKKLIVILIISIILSITSCLSTGQSGTEPSNKKNSISLQIMTNAADKNEVINQVQQTFPQHSIQITENVDLTKVNYYLLINVKEEKENPFLDQIVPLTGPNPQNAAGGLANGRVHFGYFEFSTASDISSEMKSYYEQGNRMTPDLQAYLSSPRQVQIAAQGGEDSARNSQEQGNQELPQRHSGSHEAEISLDLQAPDGPVRLRDSYRPVSEKFIDREAGLYLSAADNNDERGWDNLAYLIYADGAGEAITLGRFRYDWSRNAIHFQNRSPLDLVLTEKLAREMGFKGDERSPGIMDLGFSYEYGNYSDYNYGSHNKAFFYKSDVIGESAFILNPYEDTVFVINGSPGDDPHAVDLILKKIAFQFYNPSTKTLSPIIALWDDSFRARLIPAYKSVLHPEIPDIEVKQPVNLEWYKDKTQAVLVLGDNSIIAKHKRDGREQVIATYTSEFIDKQPEMGVGLTLSFKDETGGEIFAMDPSVAFFEKRNRNTGGRSGHTINADDLTLRFPVEEEKPRYPIGGFRLHSCTVYFTDNYAISSIPGKGDGRNSFTMQQISFSEPAQWYSDPEIALLSFKENTIVALNRLSGEEKLLLEFEESWEAEDSVNGTFNVQFKDHSGGSILGGYYSRFIWQVTINKFQNGFSGSFRFDGKDINTSSFTNYKPGSSPILSCTMTKDKSSISVMDMRMTKDASVAFKDGNTLPVRPHRDYDPWAD